MLFTVLRKEMKQIFQDKGFLLIALLQPIVMILVFGSSFQEGDINHLDTVVIDQDNSTFSHYVLDAIDKSDFYEMTISNNNLSEELIRLNNSDIRAIILIPPNFGEKINNSETGTINFYLDSSNFLVYSSLKGAKAEVIKNSLQNISNDILGELEEEREEGKKDIDYIKSIFEEVEKESDLLNKKIEELENEVSDYDSSEMQSSVDELESYIETQKESVDLMVNSFSQLSLSIQSLEVSNPSEEAKKNAIISQLSAIIQDLNDSQSEIDSLSTELDSLKIPDFENEELSNDINIRFNRIKTLFDDANSRTKGIKFDFEKLESKFLSEPLIIEEDAIYGDIRYFDYLSAGILSLVVFFISLMAPALNIVAEKESNTLYRLLTTPVSSISLFIGKFTTFLIFAFIELAYTIGLAIVLYGVRITGELSHVIIILTLLACSSISLGLFISAKVRTMQQALVLVPLIIIPSFMISHAFFPPDIMDDMMNKVSVATPMTFSNHALNAIMIKGHSLADVTGDIIALSLYALIPLILFIISYKRMKY